MAKLLLLDDEEETLTWMTAALASRGHEVKAFTSGRAALDALPSFRPDLILADVVMPEMDGITFARLAREYEVRVMFVSFAKKEAEAILAGAIGFVRKPATASEIRAAVDRVLGASGRRCTVLVVDDDDDARDLYRAFLEPRFDVLTAVNGKVALDLLHAHTVDLAIVDVHMPVMNGAELIRAMRADSALDKLPVIVQTNDRSALEAPLWGALHVAQVMDKNAFVGWFEHLLEQR